MKGYEVLSRNSAINGKALHQALPLIDALIALEPYAEIHPHAARNALMKLITEVPTLNSSKFNGSVYVNLRAERLGVLLHHVRKLARCPSVPSVVSSLTGKEYHELKETLKKVVLRKTDPDQPLKKGKAGSPLKKVSLKKDSPSKKSQAGSSKDTLKKDSPKKKTLKKDQELTLVPASVNKRKLKPTVSDVSVDSHGFPKELASPQKSPPRLWQRKRVGAMARHQASEPVHQNLKASLGLSQGGLKKPAAALKKPAAALKKPAAALKKAAGKPKAIKKNALKKEIEEKRPTKNAPLKKGRQPWARISKTTARNPARCYLTGCHHKDEKKFLIVEVTQKWSLQYSFVVDRIKEALEKDHLTKEEALQMRVDLCAKFP